MQITKLEQMFDVLRSRPMKRLVAAWANDAHTIAAAAEAVRMGLITAKLVGDIPTMKSQCAAQDIDPGIFEMIQSDSDIAAAALAVDMINRGEGDFLMKGLISTDRYMKAILNKEKGLMNPGAVLTHITVAEPLNYHKLIVFGDVAIIPEPDLNQKISICNYLIKTAQLLGVAKPKVGVLSASEQTLPKIRSSFDAALLAKMAERGQIKGGIVEGPLGLDLIIDKHSAEIKGVHSEVCGDADCILFPSIEAGNTFYKTITILLKSELCAIVMGARVPAVLTSRGDSERNKLFSIALAAMLA